MAHNASGAWREIVLEKLDIDDRLIEDKVPTRVAAGLKAALHNPNVSDEAKERAARRLESMEAESGDSGSYSRGPNSSRILGGYKATLTVSASVRLSYIQ